MGTSLAQAGGRAWETEPTPAAPPRRRHPWRRWIWVLGVLAGLAVWQVLWQTRAVPEYMLPAPAAVAAKWLTLWRAGILWHHIAATLKEALLGFAVAFVIGVGLGYPLARSDALAGVLAPYVAATQAMPVIAFAPLLVVWFGLGLLPKVIICALIVFFPILVNTMAGLRSIDRSLTEAAYSMGANGWQTLWHVEIPLALRTLLAGIKMGLTLAMTGAVVGEFVAADAGLGYLMNLGRTAYDAPEVFAAALTMAGVAILGYAGVSLLERLIITWE
ncbi:MAG TPA: ABC transporter permease [Thermomicrobiales bacterium]|nr:ABC transporter permease [Thermomicrobiales bacterium]